MSIKKMAPRLVRDFRSTRTSIEEYSKIRLTMLRSSVVTCSLSCVPQDDDVRLGSGHKKNSSFSSRGEKRYTKRLSSTLCEKHGGVVVGLHGVCNPGLHVWIMTSTDVYRHPG